MVCLQISFASSHHLASGDTAIRLAKASGSNIHWRICHETHRKGHWSWWRPMWRRRRYLGQPLCGHRTNCTGHCALCRSTLRPAMASPHPGLGQLAGLCKPMQRLQPFNGNAVEAPEEAIRLVWRMQQPVPFPPPAAGPHKTTEWAIRKVAVTLVVGELIRTAHRPAALILPQSTVPHGPEVAVSGRADGAVFRHSNCYAHTSMHLPSIQTLGIQVAARSSR